MVGLRSEPPSEQSLVVSLIENGSIETMAMGAWIPAWAVTGALLLLTGRAVHSWDQPIRGQVLTVAAMPMAISVVGFIIHMCRAGMALSAGRNLAVKKRAPGAYARTVAWLTTPTPWLLVPQVLLGVAIAIFVSSHTV